MPFRRIGIFGVGLIGGSLGLALKRFNPPPYILGVGRNSERLETARRMGAIDDWRFEAGAGLDDCDLIVLATPVEHILSILPTLGGRVQPGCVVTDVGSTTLRICAEAWKRLPPGVHFIGGHPIAGKEVAGVENCVENLFEGAPYVLCPRPDGSEKNLLGLQHLVESLGAHPCIMGAEEHDRAIAALSHLPQLLSTALANVSGKERLELAGSGLRDMTRLAGSPYAVWESILATNRENIARALDELIEHLQHVRSALERGNLAEEFAGALEIYKKLAAERR